MSRVYHIEILQINIHRRFEHDLRDIGDDLSVGFTNGTEKFLPFEEVEFEVVSPGELAFYQR